MKKITTKEKWNGYFSDVLNYLSEKYSNLYFEKAKYGKTLLVNVPLEYNVNDVYIDISYNFSDTYKVELLDIIYENRLIIVNYL